MADSFLVETLATLIGTRMSKTKFYDISKTEWHVLSSDRPVQFGPVPPLIDSETVHLQYDRTRSQCVTSPVKHDRLGHVWFWGSDSRCLKWDVISSLLLLSCGSAFPFTTANYGPFQVPDQPIASRLSPAPRPKSPPSPMSLIFRGCSVPTWAETPSETS